MCGIFSYIRITACALLLAICLCGCGVPSRQTGDAVKGDTIVMQYAGLLKMVDCDSFTVADVKNPWGQGLLQRYLLVPRSAPLPRNLPRGTVLRTPLDNLLVFSAVHAHLLHGLGASASIGGVCDSRYMLSPFVHEGISRGTIVDCGSTLNADVERVVQLSPSAIFVLPFENGGYGKIESLLTPWWSVPNIWNRRPLPLPSGCAFMGALWGVLQLPIHFFLWCVAILSNYALLSSTHCNAPRCCASSRAVPPGICRRAAVLWGRCTEWPVPTISFHIARAAVRYPFRLKPF